jgi:hypothetical protein
MDLEEQFEREYLFLTERTCRICKETKDLIDGFYLTRKGRGRVPSAYSYECKECTIKRITENRKISSKIASKWEYPDW